MSKEQKQIIILSVLLVGILGVVVYFNFDRFVPKVTSPLEIGQPIPKLQIGSAKAKEVFDRPDYLDLKEFGLIPVRPTGLGSENLFEIIETDSDADSR